MNPFDPRDPKSWMTYNVIVGDDDATRYKSRSVRRSGGSGTWFVLIVALAVLAVVLLLSR